MALLYTKRDPGFARRARRLVELAIRRYNRYRGVESRAKLIKFDGDVVIVEFRGYFCETCGINDWVDDFRYVVEDLGGKAELVSIVEPEKPEEFYDYRVGVFKIVEVPDERRLDEIEREERELEAWLEHGSENS